MYHIVSDDYARLELRSTGGSNRFDTAVSVAVGRWISGRFGALRDSRIMETIIFRDDGE
jgi:hypothetical protein